MCKRFLLTDKHACATTQVLGNDAHPICPVMLGDARLASKMAEEMLAHNIYVIGFSFPVVPRGEVHHLTATNMSGGWVLMTHRFYTSSLCRPASGCSFRPSTRPSRSTRPSPPSPTWAGSSTSSPDVLLSSQVHQKEKNDFHFE